VRNKKLLIAIFNKRFGLTNGQPIKRVSTGRIDKRTSPVLYPAKREQRQELVEDVKGGTVLEVYGGKGHLTKDVYHGKVKESILLDKDKHNLAQAHRKLDAVKMKHKIIATDNVDWLKNEMESEKLKNLKVVDFDAYGCPAEPMRVFFDNYPIKKTMFIAVTDGSKRYLGYINSEQARAWLKKTYGINLEASGTREDQIRVLDAFMQSQGRKHDFKVEPVNVAYGRSSVVYAGYKITPKNPKK
jgi:16S rRNA G966 N2-methylase RsmD